MLFLAFTFVPILFGFGVSFFRWTIIEPPVFVGIDNYTYFLYVMASSSRGSNGFGR